LILLRQFYLEAFSGVKIHVVIFRVVFLYVLEDAMSIIRVPCSLVDRNRGFRGIYFVDIQGTLKDVSDYRAVKTESKAIPITGRGGP
jgi:hypothetical protein